MTYKCFNNFYIKLCGSCDNKCDRLCKKYGIDKDTAMVMEEIEATSTRTETVSP